MSFNANEAPMARGKSYPLIEIGTYPARVVGLVDLGLQPQKYKGVEKDPCREIMVTYELVDEFLPDDDGEPDPEKPRHISETFGLKNLQLDKAKSTIRYKALDPEGYANGNWEELLGTPCSVTVTHNPGTGDKAGNVYPKVSSVAPMRAKDAEKCPPLVNNVKVFDLEDPDLEIFNGLPNWIKGKITTNLNFEGSVLKAMLGDGAPPKKESEGAETQEDGDLEDELPF